MQRTSAIAKRVLTAWILIFIALALAGWVGEMVQDKLGASSGIRYSLQALIMSGVVVPGFWLLRKRVDRASTREVGFEYPSTAFKAFVLGVGILAVPAILVILFTQIFGWGTVRTNLGMASAGAVLLQIGIAFLFEALPEELAFRGYIYRVLNSKYQKWLAGLIQVALFVLLPLLLVQVQRYVLGMEISIGGSSQISGEYLITMLLFGLFLTYLRTLTQSVWTGIGFHLAFLLVNRLIGPNPSSAIQFAEIVTETPILVTLFTSLGVILIGLFAYPWYSGKSLRWNEVNPE